MSFFSKTFQKLPCGAIFLSGFGSNAEALLNDVSSSRVLPAWCPSVLITDRPETSRAREIAAKYSLPLIEHDIRSFYHAHGLERVTIATEEGMQIRKLWTEELRKKLEPYSIQFGLFAGFITLCNISESFPCLNVHPGDLTVRENGHRIFAGLHLRPTETAILRGCSSIRSSVILTQPVTTGASEMDEGPVLGISAPMLLDLQGHSREELQKVHDARQKRKSVECKDDLLARIANDNINRLKVAGDCVVFPRVVRDFARGRFDWNQKDLLYDGRKVRTVQYNAEGEGIPQYLD